MTDTTNEAGTDATRIAFVCVRNAGRSQMAAAFAERERDRRGLTDRVEILTGGTHPAEAVHPVVVDAMAELDVDLSGRTPREIPPAELRTCDHVATMGCSTLDVSGAESDVALHEWDLPDPGGRELAEVRGVRTTVERRVRDLFDELHLR
ncbi:arsenate-mycothiol transferase ArsC [Halorarum salinum]|uniref:Low molecular weight phosphatase family protein n=1 Tax=Halorarum salinum TaxID=2743089 RepID=A0A7D5LDW5_9EURY|nr:low molecular weight phosphatase family protein [Halobaculum salinum]QLG64268.1 low molecular weight phosphatase family protein [Halobaculum salinum]